MYSVEIEKNIELIKDFRLNAYLCDNMSVINAKKLAYDKWDEYSTHLILKKNNSIIGAVRITRIDQRDSLPCFEMIKKKLNIGNESIEISRIIIHPKYRKTNSLKYILQGIKKLINIQNKNIIIDVLQKNKGICIKSYKSLGFIDLNQSYYDSRYNTKSSILLMNSNNTDKLFKRMLPLWN